MESSLKSLNLLDYLVVLMYLIMVIGVGVVVSRFNRRTTDYFKGGGHIPWVLSAVSLFVSGFSAFMFVAAAGFTYRNGSAAILLFTSACPAYILGYYVYGPLWRRTRIDTPMEFLTQRFSPGTTYFYTLISVVPNVIVLGIGIYTLCIFISSALGFAGEVFSIGGVALSGLQISMLVTGVVLVTYTMLGGLWAVMVTDALQFVILFLASLIVLPLAFLLLGDGNPVEGVTRMIAEAPDGFFGFKLKQRPNLFWAAYFLNIVLGYNVHWHIAQRYYSVADERDTKKMALWASGLSLVLPLMWIFPVMASRVLFPDLASMWPDLQDPTEAAFVTLALTVLPNGMLGVLVAAMFAATMSSADTTFNWLAAVLTRDAYAPLTQQLTGKTPSDKALLFFGKLSVAVMGVIAIWVAFSMEKLGGVFDVQTKAVSLYNAPMFVPVLLGLLITRTPWWSGVVSMIVGVLSVVGVSLGVNAAHGLPADSFGSLFLDIDLHVLGMRLTRYELQMLTGILTTTAVFLLTMCFPIRSDDHERRIARFRENLATPAFADPLERLDLRGLRAYRLTGRLTIIIGAMLLLMVFPTLKDPQWGVNLVGALLAIGTGVFLLRLVRRIQARFESSEPDDR